MIQELKNLDNFGSFGTGTTVFGYDPDSDKYGKISVNQLHRDTWCSCRWRDSNS